MSPTQVLDGSIFGSHLVVLKTILTIFRLNVHILQILKYVDISSMSPNSIMLFHNIDSTLIHCLSRYQQNRPHRVNLLISATPLKVRLLHFLKESCSLPKTIALSMYSFITIKYHTDFVSSIIAYQ